MSTYTTGGPPRSWPAAGALFVVVGLIWIILGFVCIAAPLYAALAAVWLFGILLIVGGVLHTVHAFTTRGWEGFILHLLEGLLSIIVGALLLSDPVGGIVGLTLLIGVFLAVGGVLRCVLGFMARRSRAWGWLVLSGVLELILGVIVLTGWPGSAAWVIGLFIGIRMLFAGTSMVALGLAPHGDPVAPV